MKQLRSFLLCIIAISGLTAQPNDSIPTNVTLQDSLIASKVKEAIGEEEYVRIPKKDFDAIIDNVIGNKINDRLNFLAGFALAVIGILSTLSIIRSNKSRDSLKEQIIDQMNAKLESKNLETRDFFENSINARIDEKLEVAKSSITQNFKQVAVEEAQDAIKKAEDYLINAELKELKELIYDKRYYDHLTLERTKDLLQSAEERNKPLLIREIVNLLSAIYYENKQYNEVTNLIEGYKDKVELRASSYINAALTAFYDYHNFNSKPQRTKALEYLDKSLELTQGYGEALGLKLQIFTMDYLRTEDSEVKNEALQALKAVFDDALNSESNAPARETVLRLDLANKLEPYKKYIDKLNELFPKEMAAMYTRAEV